MIGPAPRLRSVAEILARGATPESPVAPVLPFDPIERVKAALSDGGPGWIVIRSRTLGREVLWTRDEWTPVPRHLASLPRFTLAELERLLDGEATPDDLRSLGAVKEAGGELVHFRRPNA